MIPVDRDSPLPLWAQIEADLRVRLAANEFEAGVPPEGELATAYAVSRHTVREALRRLTASGLIHRQRGRGTAVAPAESLEQRVGTFYSLAQTIEARGLSEHSVVTVRERATSAEAARQLSLRPGTPLVHIARVRHAGDEALALDDSWLPYSSARILLDREFEHGSLYQFLAENAGVRLSGGRERITAVTADAGTAAALDLPPDVALFRVDRLTYAGDQPIEWRVSLVRGDRFVFASDWGAGHRSA